MSQAPTNPYLRTKVMTASQEQLRLMLYDGAIKFCRQGRDALTRTDFEGMYNALSRAQKIVLELSTSLNHSANPDLCDKMAALYDYIHRRLVDANIERDTAAIDEALHLLEYERETWQMLINKLQKERAEGETAESPADDTATAAERENPIANIGPEHANPAPASRPTGYGAAPGGYSDSSSGATGGFFAQG